MNVLIIEDELHTSSLLQEIIEQDNDFIVTQKLESVIEAVDYLNKYQKNIDLCFFDIQLADGKSFEIFKHVDVIVPIIFCTAFDEYSLDAIKNNGIDYVLKPFKEKEIKEALQKYKRLLANLQKTSNVPFQFQTEKEQKYQQNFLIQFREKTIVKRVEEVALFRVENETVFLYNYKGEKFPLYKKMEYLEKVCHPDHFFRINRQMLLHRNAIHSFEPYFNRKITLQLLIKLDEKAIVSRLKVSSFKNWLEK